jgi:hypothetical protein
MLQSQNTQDVVCSCMHAHTHSRRSERCSSSTTAVAARLGYSSRGAHAAAVVGAYRWLCVVYLCWMLLYSYAHCLYVTIVHSLQHR